MEVVESKEAKLLRNASLHWRKTRILVRSLVPEWEERGYTPAVFRRV